MPSALTLMRADKIRVGADARKAPPFPAEPSRPHDSLASLVSPDEARRPKRRSSSPMPEQSGNGRDIGFQR